MLGKLNEHLRWRYDRLRYRFASEVVDRTIGGIEAKFQAGTFREFRRLDDFTGERWLIATLLETTGPDDVFWDIGANVGTHTCFVGQVASETVAVEPHPATAARLLENASLNGVDVTLQEFALSDERGKVELLLPAKNTKRLGMGNFSLVLDHNGGSGAVVDAVPGDDLIAEHDLPAPTVAKIDVEGAELDVIEGMSESFSGCREIYCEIHTQHVSSDDVVARLEDMGFVVTRIGERSGDIHVRAA